MSSYNLTYTNAGPITPPTPEVQAAVLQYWQAAFGNRLNPDMATPQGQVITSETAVIQDKNNQLLYLAQQFDPQQASGRWQDALAAIYFISRQAARPTIVQCVCMGLPGTVIPGSDDNVSPALVKSSEGYLLYCQRTSLIPPEGTITVPFACVDAGPLEIEAHSVTTIINAIPGWDTIDNPAVGVVGTGVESRAAFEARRFRSVALNSISMLDSVYARVANVEGVIDTLALQNRGDTPITVRGITMGPHSVYICALGGADYDIALAMYNSISAGCDYNGTTVVPITSPSTGAIENVKFQRPTELPVYITVTISPTPSTPSDVAMRIKANVVADFYGLPWPYQADGIHADAQSTRVHIGDTIYTSRFMCPVLAAGAAAVASIVIDVMGGSGGGTKLEMNYSQYASLTEDHVAVYLETK